MWLSNLQEDQLIGVLRVPYPEWHKSAFIFSFVTFWGINSTFFLVETEQTALVSITGLIVVAALFALLTLFHLCGMRVSKNLSIETHQYSTNLNRSHRRALVNSTATLIRYQISNLLARESEIPTKAPPANEPILIEVYGVAEPFHIAHDSPCGFVHNSSQQPRSHRPCGLTPHNRPHQAVLLNSCECLHSHRHSESRNQLAVT